MDTIIAKLHVLTITNIATSPLPSSSPTIESLEHALNQLTLGDISRPYHSPSSAAGVPASSLPPDGDLQRLWLLDEKLDAHMKSILLCLDALSSPNLSSQHGVEVDLVE